MLEDALQKCAVIGAGGKMGSGIALLLLQAGAKVICLDSREEALSGLRSYLKTQLEKRELGENLANASFTTNLNDLADCTLLFEAIVEDAEVKVALFKKLKSLGVKYFFSNTSSIPIHYLNREAALENKIIGYHFYNPPVVQKLLEVITTEATEPSLKTIAVELAVKLGKTVVPSHDVAGFIGNGHFVRDVLHACSEVEELNLPEPEAIWALNRVTQEWLIRPMGIFQLLDYVGIDVAQKIFRVMSKHIEGESFHSTLIDRMLESGIRGGQLPDGSQRNGFFKYEKGKPTEVYDLKSEKYSLVDVDLGTPPNSCERWKDLLKDPKREQKLAHYFSELEAAEGVGSALARKYHRRSKEIGETLVNSGVCETAEAVNQVLTLGFFHLYGPINDLLESRVSS